MRKKLQQTKGKYTALAFFNEVAIRSNLSSIFKANLIHIVLLKKFYCKSAQ